MKYIITESQYNKLFDRYISREFDGVEKKTLSTKYQYSIFWIKDGNIVAEIKNNEYFIACFDSLRKMNKVIEYLSKFGNKKEWLIYSSEIDYNLIDTKDWIDKYVFFTPSIIYGIDYNYKEIDVFCFVYKNHLNPLQIYQMISRARKQKNVHIYCNEKESYIKYKSI
jgi:hypothetical protein